MSVLMIAKVCHEVNKAFCEAIGDPTQKSWEEASSWQRASSVAGIIAYIEGRVKTPEDAHKEWLAHKLKEGWSYGFVKSEDSKEHPCMVAYDELPKEQKVKDCIFYAIVRTMYESNDSVIELEKANIKLSRLSKALRQYKRGESTLEQWMDSLDEVLEYE